MNTPGNTSTDFLAAVVALSSIVLFAKFVTHRTRDTREVTKGVNTLHVVCTGLSVVALVCAFIGLELEESPPLWFDITAAVSMAGALTILVGDALRNDRKLIQKKNAADE